MIQTSTQSVKAMNGFNLVTTQATVWTNVSIPERVVSVRTTETEPNMDSRRTPIDTFLDDIAAETVTPAGGSGAAVVAAIGASLCEMAAIHSQKSSHAGEMMDRSRRSLATHRSRLLDLADADAQVVAAVFGDSTETEQQTALKQATGIPLSIAETSLHILEDAERVMDSAPENVAPDALTGVFVTQAALRAALYTVRTNLAWLEDDTAVEKFRTRLADIETRREAVSERLNDHVVHGGDE